LAFCPRKFTKLLKPVYSHLRQLGHLSAVVGDDDCERNVSDTVKLFDSLGFIVHPEKSSFVPQHRITFMGFIIDSITMTVYPTSVKLRRSFIPAAKLGPFHCRSLNMDKTEALQLNKGNFDAFMQLSELSRSAFQWWINSVRSLINPISPPQPEITL